MDIEQLLNQAGVKYVKREHPVAYTAQEVAAEEHVSGDMLAKPVVVQADDRSVMCVLPASYKVDLGKLGQALQVRQCRLAQEAEMAKLFPDVELGAEPPFGKLYGMPTLVDGHLSTCRRITFTAGTHQKTIEMDYADYVRLVEPTVADFSVHL